jgi:WXG100 family type VII secretion target
VDKSTADAHVLAQVAGRFEEVRDELQTKLNTLRTIVDGVRADWQGSAGTSFQNVTTAWTERQTDLITTLTQTAQGIRDAGKFYASSNDGAASKITNSVDLSALAGAHHSGGSQ